MYQFKQENRLLIPRVDDRSLWTLFFYWMKKQSYSSSVKQVSTIGDSDGYRNTKHPNPGAKPPIFLLPEQSPNPLLIGVKDDAMFLVSNNNMQAKGKFS